MFLVVWVFQPTSSCESPKKAKLRYAKGNVYAPSLSPKEYVLSSSSPQTKLQRANYKVRTTRDTDYNAPSSKTQVVRAEFVSDGIRVEPIESPDNSAVVV